MIRPSPNEVLQFTKDEALKRRRIRLQQVREQEKLIARQIRDEVRQKQAQEISKLSSALKREWIAKHQENLADTEAKYLAGLNLVGHSHKEAEENAPNQAMRDAEAQRQASIARIREKIALKNEQLIREKKNETYTKKLQSLKTSQAKERIRAKHIAQLPNKENEIDSLFDKESSGSRSSTTTEGQGMYTTISENSTATVNLGLPSNDGVVEKEELFKDARHEAQVEEERINLLQAEKERLLMEQLAKAKVRHQVALQKTRLNSVGSKCMQELKEMQKRDAIRRQNNIRYSAAFKPLNDPLHANKDMFTDSLLFGHRPPVSEKDLDVTIEDDSQSIELDTNPAPVQSNAMNKLLNQIDQQRKAKQESRKLASLSSVTEDGPISKVTYEDNFDMSCNESVKTPSPVSLNPENEPTVVSQSEDELACRSEILESNDTSEPPTNEHKEFVVSSDNSTQDLVMNFNSTIESLKSNKDLMKSVENFQRRILSQQSSSDQIKQQINILEAKKAKLDHLISEIAKSK